MLIWPWSKFAQFAIYARRLGSKSGSRSQTESTGEPERSSQKRP